MKGHKHLRGILKNREEKPKPLEQTDRLGK
jgi:hypothetical protein